MLVTHGLCGKQASSGWKGIDRSRRSSLLSGSTCQTHSGDNVYVRKFPPWLSEEADAPEAVMPRVSLT